MSDLSPRELDVLDRMARSNELSDLFFRHAKGLKWFDDLEGRGYFLADKIPPPQPAQQEGYVNVPSWAATNYLVQASSELLNESNIIYASRFLDIIRDVTNYSLEKDFGNYKVWLQFAKIIKNIPNKLIQLGDLELVKYWLNDRYDRGLIVDSLGGWVSDLLDDNSESSGQLAKGMIEKIFEFDVITRMTGSSEKKEAVLRFDSYHANKLLEMIGFKAGEVLQGEVIEIFQARLEGMLEALENDRWSVIWRSAIEEHEQNHGNDDASDILVKSLRDSLLGYFNVDPDGARIMLAYLLDSQFVTVHRIGLYVAGEQFENLNGELIDLVTDERFFTDYYRHEQWWFLKKNFPHFEAEIKTKTISIIQSLRISDDGIENPKSSAYAQLNWLSAIKGADDSVSALYIEKNEITGVEPENPDFSSYMSVGWSGPESPFSVEELRPLSPHELVEILNNYKDPGSFREPGLEGLVKTFKELVKVEPRFIYEHLGIFVELKLPFVYELIEAFVELWKEKYDIEWYDTWPELLEFVTGVMNKESFSLEVEDSSNGLFVATGNWVVSSIGRLIEEGCKSDDHAFERSNIAPAREILRCILQKQAGEKFELDSDAVMVAINSPRGRCLAALINLALFECRQEHKATGDHSKEWANYNELFDSELLKADAGEYEFATIVADYIHNFLYLSETWLMSNLSTIFDQNNYLRWLSAMQGYSYSSRLHPGIYNYLKENGDFLKALDDKNLKERRLDTFIQFICLSFLQGDEPLDDTSSLLLSLIDRGNQTELNQIIWFIWTLRDKSVENIQGKVFELFPKLLSLVDSESKEGRKLASSLCRWSVYIDNLDGEQKEWLLDIAQYSEEDHNASAIMESLARLSARYPFESYEIWAALLTSSSYDYPDESIKVIFTNLIQAGPDGVVKAKDIAGLYLKHGLERPLDWLTDIQKSRADSVL
jgi:hypothetical protein